MEEHVTPGAFYGSALAALCGLAMGLMLHGSWTNHTHGPQLQLSSAAAEELARPGDDQEPASAPAPQQAADLNTDYVAPTPLPVPRLDPDRFDVKPAAEDAVREDVDDPVPDAAPGPAGEDLDLQNRIRI